MTKLNVISVFCYEKKEKYNFYVSSNTLKKYALFFIENFNTFMYDYILHRGRKHFCCYRLQAACIEEILKLHISDCSKINGKK